jgi:hypothetical protein
MQQSELPAGYKPQRPSARVPSIDATDAADPQAQLASLSRDGFVVGFTQTLSTADAAPLPQALLVVYLMSGPDAARTYTTDPARQPAATASSRVDHVIPAIAAGDVSITWRLAQTLAEGDSRAGYEVRWQRNQLVFVLVTFAPYGHENIDDARALVQAVDHKAASAGVPLLGAPTVTPPADESTRLAVALRLRDLLLHVSQAPAGYQLRLADYLHPADDILGNSTPRRTLATLDQRERRIAGVAEIFSSGTQTVGLSVNRDADAASARLDLASSGPSANVVQPPAALGDQASAFAYRRTQPDGTQVDDLDVYWLHGALIFNAEIVGPAGQLDSDALTVSMKAMESRYQASGLGTAPGTPQGLHATALDATAVRLDWTNPDDRADAYAVYDTGTGAVLGLTGPGAATFTLTGLRRETRYCLSVYGYGAAGSGAQSEAVCVTTPG